MSSNITTSVETITPEQALEILGNHENNRNLRARVVTTYARDICDGNWSLNGETIKIDVNGNLIDGQHRLNAVIVADMPAEFLVVRGLPTRAMDTIDSGAKRMAGDVLALRGEKYTNVLAAAARRLILRGQGLYLTNGVIAPSTSEVLAYVEEHPTLRRSCEVAVEHKMSTIIPPSVSATGHYLTSKISPESADWFYARAADQDVPINHPARTLIQQITAIRLAGKRPNSDECMAYTFMAWNKYRAGHTVTRFRLPPGGLTSTNFPQPK